MHIYKDIPFTELLNSITETSSVIYARRMFSSRTSLLWKHQCNIGEQFPKLICAGGVAAKGMQKDV